MKPSLVSQNIEPPLKQYEDLCQTLIIDLSKNFGGADIRVLNLMRKLPRDRVALATLQNSPLAYEAERAGLRVFKVGKEKSSWEIVPNLVSIIRRDGVQVLDTQNPQSKLWGSICAGLTGVALVSTLNSWYANEHGKRSLKGLLYAMLELNTNSFLDRYIVVARSIFDALVESGVAPNKIDLIYNAVESDWVPVVASGIIQSLNFPDESIALLAVGRLTWAKGYEDLIRAVESLVKEDRRIRCLIAGEGELRERLETLIEQIGLTENICLLGHVSHENVLSLIAASDIFVMPSRSEGTPIALLEAAILRKPIVATSVGGIPELVNNEEECLLVEPGNVFQLAASIRRLIQNKRFAERLGNHAYQRASRDFSLDVQAHATIQSYNKAFQSRNARM